MPFDHRKFPEMVPHSYERVRSELRTGDLLLCSGTGIFSELIKAATESEFSHVGFIVRNNEIDRLFVYESVESVGVRPVVLSNYVKNYLGSGSGYPGRIMIARHAKFDQLTDAIKLVQFGADHFSYPFDKDEIIRIAARIMSVKLGMLNGEFKRDKEFICSEYVFEAFAAAGIHYDYDPRGFITPSDFPKNPHTFPVAVIALGT